MKYLITLPINACATTSSVPFLVHDFRSLRRFFYQYATIAEYDGTEYKGFKTLAELLDNSGFMKSDLVENSYIYKTVAYCAIDDNWGSWDEFLDNGYLYSVRTGDFIYEDNAVHIEDIGDYVSQSYADRYFYQHNDGRYYSEPEYEEEEDNYVRSYHSGYSKHFKGFDFSEYDGYSIGIEFEKEDSEVKYSQIIFDFEYLCEDWRKEEDGSLDCDSGFELISPIYPLIPELILEDIKSNKTLLSHINAETSSSCGGHMNLSCNRYSSNVLFDRVKYYLPMLYAMYPNRRYITYCEKKKILGNEESYQRKYSPIAIKSDRIEFRIFSAIKNVKQLEFRLKLVKMMAENKVSSFHQVLSVMQENKDIFLSVYSEQGFAKMMQRTENEISEELASVA